MGILYSKVSLYIMHMRALEDDLKKIVRYGTTLSICFKYCQDSNIQYIVAWERERIVTIGKHEKYAKLLHIQLIMQSPTSCISYQSEISIRTCPYGAFITAVGMQILNQRHNVQLLLH